MFLKGAFGMYLRELLPDLCHASQPRNDGFGRTRVKRAEGPAVGNSNVRGTASSCTRSYAHRGAFLSGWVRPIPPDLHHRRPR